MLMWKGVIFWSLLMVYFFSKSDKVGVCAVYINYQYPKKLIDYLDNHVSCYDRILLKNKF